VVGAVPGQQGKVISKPTYRRQCDQVWETVGHSLESKLSQAQLRDLSIVDHARRRTRRVGNGKQPRQTFYQLPRARPLQSRAGMVRNRAAAAALTQNRPVLGVSRRIALQLLTGKRQPSATDRTRK